MDFRVYTHTHTHTHTEKHTCRGLCLCLFNLKGACERSFQVHQCHAARHGRSFGIRCSWLQPPVDAFVCNERTCESGGFTFLMHSSLFGTRISWLQQCAHTHTYTHTRVHTHTHAQDNEYLCDKSGSEERQCLFQINTDSAKTAALRSQVSGVSRDTRDKACVVTSDSAPVVASGTASMHAIQLLL